MRFGIGTAQFGMDYGISNSDAMVSQKNIVEILNYSRLKNIKTIDTAIAYGKSEHRLGLAGVNDFEVISKIPQIPIDNVSSIEEWVVKQVNQSLSKLKIKKLEAVLLHRPDQLLEKEGPELISALNYIKEIGLVKKIGISIYSPCELDSLCNTFSLDIVQAPFNIFDRRISSSGWLKKLKENNIEVHTRSAFLQGLLLLEKNQIPEQFNKWNILFDEWHSWLKNSKLNPIQGCLSFILSNDLIDKFIIGIQSKNQLKDLINLANYKPNFDFPDIGSDDENLVNPSKW